MVLMWASQTPELTWLFWSLQFKPLLIASVLQPMWCKREKITAFGSWGNKPCMTFLGQFFFSVPQQPNSILGLLVTEVHRLHTIRQTRGRTPLNTSEHLWTPLNKRSAPRKNRYLHNTQRTQKKHVHALSGIRTCYPSNQTAPDLRLRPVFLHCRAAARYRTLASIILDREWFFWNW